MASRPADTEYAPFFAGYVSLVPEPDLLAMLESQPAGRPDYSGVNYG